jgi:hypothetical protein
VLAFHQTYTTESRSHRALSALPNLVITEGRSRLYKGFASERSSEELGASLR